MNWLADPESITRQSFAHIRQALALQDWDPAIVPVIERVVHASGMLDLVDAIAHSDDFAARGIDALRRGRPVFCDCAMVAAGLTRTPSFHPGRVQVMIDHPDVACHARARCTTRSAAAIDVWRTQLNDALIVIGNAPTALFRLLERVTRDAITPAAIIGIPVGFIGATESKERLIVQMPPVAYFTVRGTRGGSAMASAALNALVRMAAGQGNTAPPGTLDP